MQFGTMLRALLPSLFLFHPYLTFLAVLNLGNDVPMVDTESLLGL